MYKQKYIEGRLLLSWCYVACRWDFSVVVKPNFFLFTLLSVRIFFGFVWIVKVVCN